MPQATWNGFLRLSLVSCPVYLSPATTDKKRVHLDQLSARTGNPVTQQYVDARTGDVVSPDALVKGYQFEGGRYVSISDSELQALRSEPSKIIDVDHFAAKDEIDRLYLGDAYYLYPDGQLASDTVHAVRLAMERNGRVALARIQLTDREQQVLIEPREGGLMMSTLRNTDDVEAAEFVERSEEDIPAEMIEIAESIIGRRTGVFDTRALRDPYEEALRRLVEGKVQNAPPGPRGAEPQRAPEPQVRPAVEAESPPPAPPPSPPPAPPAEPEPEAAAVTEARGEIAEGADAAAQLAAVAPATEAALEEVTEASGEPEPPATAAPSEPAAAAGAASADAPAGTREVGTEILLHIVGLGDRRYVEPGWAGNPGSRRQIEALSIRPREGLTPSAVEFKVFAQEGRATSWVSDGNYAGTRGRGLPLTGFAVRPAQDLRERLEIVYEGCFFEGGVVGPKRDGELCISPIANDPLEAVRVSILERAEE
jgi:DNA end-binding protein Ku